MAGQITNTQEVIESLLLAEPYFSDITIVRIDKGDIQNIIDEAIAKIGICVLIMTPRLACRFKDVPGPYWDIFATCEVVENVVINRSSDGTNKPASEVAEYVASTIHHKPESNAFVHVSTELTGIGKDTERNQTLITYATDFVNEGGVALDINRVATPVIADNGSGEITITCSTVGVSIFYTTNGNNPGPQSTGASLYTAPFNVLSGETVRVRAWIWGYTVSQEATYTRP